tara:strand:- start:9058 stop:10785 length:1728 start_codon:yes stop_codon:yes gene_type:complete
MNIFDDYLEKIKLSIKFNNKENSFKIPKNFHGINVDSAPSKFNADVSTNVCMVISSLNKVDPKKIFNSEIIQNLKNDENIEKFDFAKPGFVNIKFKKKYWNIFLCKLLKKDKYGSKISNKNEKYLVEFVSANPTGPLHVGHCRGAIFGDVLCNLLKFYKHTVIKEYYINDHGNQIINFSLSVFYRIREKLFNDKFPNDENLYPGEYISDIANNIIENKFITNFDNFEDIKENLTNISIKFSIDIIKNNLNSLGVIHDNFVSEKKIIEDKEIDEVIDLLKNKNLVYTGKIDAPEGEDNSNWIKREQLLFKSSNFGDDKDRALKKEDDTWTYFAGDIAYHNNKLKRKFNNLINILGADHAGYIKRISSVVEALSENKQVLNCKVTQLVKLIKDGKPFKMSKRKGDYITVDDLVNEVGKDATRFIMLSRSPDVQLEFDFEKVKEKSKDNPLYYVQYCYARICSVFSNANVDIVNRFNTIENNFEFNDEEIKIINKISEWPRCIETSIHKLEPHRIAIYLYQLSSLFHSYWNMGRINKSMRFLDTNKVLDKNKAVLLNCISKTIKTGMDILGVSTPKNM